VTTEGEPRLLEIMRLFATFAVRVLFLMTLGRLTTLFLLTRQAPSLQRIEVVTPVEETNLLADWEDDVENGEVKCKNCQAILEQSVNISKDVYCSICISELIFDPDFF